MIEAVIVAACPGCGGIKGIECENGRNETVQLWIDRGDLIGAEILSVIQGKTDWKCTCRSDPQRPEPKFHYEFENAAPVPDFKSRPERCPTCGSDDPKYFKGPCGDAYLETGNPSAADPWYERPE